MTAWKDRSGTAVFRKSPDKAWPLRRVEETTDNIVPLKRKGAQGG